MFRWKTLACVPFAGQGPSNSLRAARKPGRLGIQKITGGCFGPPVWRVLRAARKPGRLGIQTSCEQMFRLCVVSVWDSRAKTVREDPEPEAVSASIHWYLSSDRGAPVNGRGSAEGLTQLRCFARQNSRLSAHFQGRDSRLFAHLHGQNCGILAIGPFPDFEEIVWLCARIASLPSC